MKKTTILLIFSIMSLLLLTTSVISVSVWDTGIYYSIGDKVTYNGDTYECIQAHTSLIGWEPSNVPALWKKVVDISSGETEWESGVSYTRGDKILYNDLYYICVQSHTSQADWQPSVVPALWEKTITEDYSNELKDYLVLLYGEKELQNWNITNLEKSIKVITYDLELENINTGEKKSIVWYQTIK